MSRVKNDFIEYKSRICSECGREFSLNTDSGDYKYRLGSEYQCSYTCYDHILLRKSTEKSKLTPCRYKSNVIKSENTMKAQGKSVLHPIKL